MANRKVLINRHSTRNQAPVASEMFHGEIAVSHPSDLSATTIWTRNDDVMVPFASCAMTMQMIDNAIAEANVIYDVVAKANEEHLEVATGLTGDTKTFTLNTKDVQSESAFNDYSAATETKIDNIADAVTDLTNVVLTGISGDSVIVAEILNPTTGANYVALTHRTGDEASGFNKFATDAYGHVTGHTAVTTEDIQALGFKTSAETGEDLDALSASVVTNKANIEALSAGTQHDIEVLSGDVVEYVKVVSGNIETVINELSANTMAGDAAVFASAKTYTDEAIEGLDSEGKVSAAGKYLTGIGIANGKISGITEADLPILTTAKTGTGNVVSNITVNDHQITYATVSVATSEDIADLSAATINLSAATTAISEDLKALSGVVEDFSGATDAKIFELSGATAAISGYAATQIAALSAGTLQLSADTDAAIDALTSNLSNLSAVTLTGVSLNNTPLTVTDHVVSVPVADDKSDIAGATATGNVADAKAVKDYVEEILSSSVDYKGATASAPTGTPSKGDLYIASGDFTIDGKNVETGDFIIYNGESWDVIEKNLDGAITGNLTANTVVLGDSTNSVKSLANGSAGQVLTMVDGAPAWADDPELTVVSAGTGNVLTNITVDDHEITFTKGITAASNAELQALSSATVAFSAATDAKFTTLSAYTKDVDDKVKALSAGTIQLSTDAKAAIEQLSGFAHNSMIARDDAVFSSAKTYADEKVAAEIALLDSVGSASTTGHYLTSVTITDGKITAVGEVAVPANVAITASTAAAVNTPSAVLTGVTANGTDNHNLTFGMSNMVFSAKTSESADTAAALTGNITSGQVSDIVAGIENTKVHEAESADTAVSANKVANALSVSGYSNSSASTLDTAIAYDGSQPKSLTFGTNGNAGLKSMSMTSAGVVDVEVIDCGEY